MEERILIFVPTYNERDNAPELFHAILGLKLQADILFLDDNSPDGTGQLLDELASKHPQLKVIHRSGKLGIGSAHQQGISYAYEHGYDRLITMDCDFTHPPDYIPKILEASRKADVAIGSRWMEKGSLPGWNLLRRFLTHLGHFLTWLFLGIQHDASGAFRAYSLKAIRREVFLLVRSKSYSFFFESLFILVRNGCSITEIPIHLPARTYGHSKMTFRDAARSARFLYSLWLETRLTPERFRVPKAFSVAPGLNDPQGWDGYWSKTPDASGAFYQILAAIYRRLFIRSRLERTLSKHFADGSRLLHAGCGSGQIDKNLHDRFRITAMDICIAALRGYSQNNPKAAQLDHGSVFALQYEPSSFDGIYNLGVMEHFTAEDIGRILKQFHAVLKPGGHVVLFWPHRRATTVPVIKLMNWCFRTFLGRKENLHPAEISLLTGKEQATQFLREAGFELASYTFSPRDLFVQAVVVGRKAESSART